MKQIQLETVDDAISVFNNWHQDILMIMDGMVASSQDAHVTPYHIETMRTLVRDSPFTSNHFINTQVMYENIEIIERMIND